MHWVGSLSIVLNLGSVLRETTWSLFTWFPGAVVNSRLALDNQAWVGMDPAASIFVRRIIAVKVNGQTGRVLTAKVPALLMGLEAIERGGTLSIVLLLALEAVLTH